MSESSGHEIYVTIQDLNDKASKTEEIILKLEATRRTLLNSVQTDLKGVGSSKDLDGFRLRILNTLTDIDNEIICLKNYVAALKDIAKVYKEKQRDSLQQAYLLK